MPIADGFEACQNIRQIYKRSGIFDCDVNNPRGSLEEEAKMEEANNGLITQSKESLIPVLIACSGFVNERVLKKTKDAGFEATFEVPLSMKQIEDIIMPLLEKRHNRLKRDDKVSFRQIVNLSKEGQVSHGGFENNELMNPNTGMIEESLIDVISEQPNESSISLNL